MVKNFWRYVYSTWHDPRTWPTHRQTDTAWRLRPRLHSIARQKIERLATRWWKFFEDMFIRFCRAMLWRYSDNPLPLTGASNAGGVYGRNRDSGLIAGYRRLLDVRSAKNIYRRRSWVYDIVSHAPLAIDRLRRMQGGMKKITIHEQFSCGDKKWC